MKLWGPWLVMALLLANGLSWLWISGVATAWGWGPAPQRAPEQMLQTHRPQALMAQSEMPSGVGSAQGTAEQDHRQQTDQHQGQRGQSGLP
jgi:hypothetical protein